MFCPSCGNALNRPTKFCSRCGALLQTPTEVSAQEKRFDEYLDGLFWTAFFGLGLILGGMVVMNEVLHFSRGWVIGYGLFSALIFLTIFGLSLWQTFVIGKTLNKSVRDVLPGARDTNKMLPAASEVPVEPVNSITENTTRNFAAVPVEVGKQEQKVL